MALWRSGGVGVGLVLAAALGSALPAVAAPPDSLSPAIGQVDSVRMAADSTLAPARPIRRPRPVSVAPT